MTDEALCAKCESHGNPALLLLKVTVTEAYFHCEKGFIRSNLWQPDARPDEETRVSFGKEIGDNIGEGKAFVEDLNAQIIDRYNDSL